MFSNSRWHSLGSCFFPYQPFLSYLHHILGPSYCPGLFKPNTKWSSLCWTISLKSLAVEAISIIQILGQLGFITICFYKVWVTLQFLKLFSLFCMLFEMGFSVSMWGSSPLLPRSLREPLGLVTLLPLRHHLSTISAPHVFPWFLLAVDTEANFWPSWGLRSKSGENALWPSWR